LVRICTRTTQALAKLENHNPTGSHKDRAAPFYVDALAATGRLRAGSEILISSSGGYGRSLAQETLHRNVKLHVITDVLSSPGQIRSLANFPHVRVTVVDDPDETGSHLAARKRLIQELLRQDATRVFADQYDNFILPMAYAETLAPEIYRQTHGLVSAIFVVVGTGATQNGILQYKVQHGVRWRVIAVDAVGSALFHTAPAGAKRRLPGYGNGLRTGLVAALPKGLDAVVHVRDEEVVAACQHLRREGLMLGPSSGAAVAALDYVVGSHPELLSGPGMPVLIMPDGGEHYLETVYDDGWLRSKGLNMTQSPVSGGAL
jgi:cysteine synthase A